MTLYFDRFTNCPDEFNTGVLRQRILKQSETGGFLALTFKGTVRQLEHVLAPLFHSTTTENNTHVKIRHNGTTFTMACNGYVSAAKEYV